MKRDAEGSAAGIYSQNYNRMLEGFQGELTRLLGEVSEIADQLGSVSTADEAVANDLGPAWKSLTALADDYALLRDAQTAVMSSAHLIDYVTSSRPTIGGESHASDLYLKNLDQIWRSWRNPGQIGERVININGALHRYEPWPPDRAALLLWLVNSPAVAWIPKPSELEQHWADRQAKANPMPTVIRQRKDLNRQITRIA